MYLGILMEIRTNIENINEELILIYNLFRGHILDKGQIIDVDAVALDGVVCTSIIVNGVVKLKTSNPFVCKNGEKESKYIKRYAKIALYRYLSKISRYNAPWGSLTGIRPTKLFYELLLDNTYKNARRIFTKEFLVSNKKCKIVERIIEQQSKISIDHKTIDLYINIPFCVSKCYYCSFISLPLSKCESLVAPYVDTLIYELRRTFQYIQDKGMSINTVYIGGGTPTAIGVKNLSKILDELPKNIKELTVEAGRPDTIDEEMLDMLHLHNVTRISINPQSFNDNTLALIGRSHNAQDVIDKYEMARKYNFVINMDLIAGLGDETFKDFKYSLDKTIALNPDNITVHTLSIKRASQLKMEGGKTSNTKQVEKMVEYATKKLLKAGYNPYYLYRQKDMIGNFENIGFCRKGTVCEFNVNSMEETLSVIANGANAISKKINYTTNRITRHANVKNIEQYIDRIDEMINAKFNLFDN